MPLNIGRFHAKIHDFCLMAHVMVNFDLIELPLNVMQ